MRTRASSAVFSGSAVALRTRAPSAVFSDLVESGAPAESWSAPFSHGVSLQPGSAYSNPWSFLVDVTPEESWSNIFDKTNLTSLSGQVTSGVYDHFAELPDEDVTSGAYDHFASILDVSGTSGLFDHAADGIPGQITSGAFDHDADATSSSDQPTSGLFDHDAIAVPSPFTPIDPTTANPPELKIKGLLEPGGCVGTGGGQSPGVCGTELGFENVVEET